MKSVSFNFPLICVGNLAAGGTGKTPMTEYLVELLQKKHKPATLSRGYKRKTKGFAIAGPATTALEIGDEPMQFHEKFPGVTVAVGEERLEAIPHILHDRPETDVIILDDAFQHRTVRAGLNIILTEYKNLFSRDLMLPAGDLRDVKKSAERAEIIIVTKCRADISEEEKKSITAELKIHPKQKIFFTRITYSVPVNLFSGEKTSMSAQSDVLLITGIANPKPLKEYITQHVHSYDMLRYPDHHIFSSGDLKDIIQHFQRLTAADKLIITTEKDGVRLKKFKKELQTFPVYVLPIRHSFLFGEEDQFNEIVLQFVNSFETPKR